MIITTAAYKTAIRASSRKIKAKLVLSDLTLDRVGRIELDSMLTDEDDFAIGTANMDVMKIEISDDPLAPLLYSFDGKEMEVQLGVVLADSTMEYHPIGKFTVEKSDRKDSKIYLDLVDRMHKADKLYISDLTYPATIEQILISAANQAGLTLSTGSYANMNYIVNTEPVYEDITCRQVFAYVAELAGGYARINRSGSLVIMTLGALPVVSITGDHYIDWKKAESAPGVIDRVIVKSGTEEATAGAGINIYTIIDNLFVQTPANVVANIYNVLSSMNYKAGELNWIGDHSLEMGDKVTIDGEDTYVLNRKLKYAGGLREAVKMPGKSNIEKNSTGKPNTNLQINQIKTQLRIQDGLINQKIADDEQAFSEINQEIDNITQTVSDKADQSQVNQLADEITSRVTQTQVEDMIAAINSAKPNLITGLAENWEQGTLNSATGNMEVSIYHIRSKAFAPVRQGYVTIKVAPLYEALIVVYNNTYGFKESHGFINEFTFLLSENAYFKVVLKRANSSEILPEAIGTAELKVENNDVDTQWTPYFGDLTLEQQQEFYQLEVTSNNGWTVDSDVFTTTLTARLLLFNEDVTTQYQAYQFTWYKQYPSGVKISLGNGTTKTITGLDMEKSATITCEFEILDTIYTIATFNGDTLLTITNDTIMVIGDYQ